MNMGFNGAGEAIVPRYTVHRLIFYFSILHLILQRCLGSVWLILDGLQVYVANIVKVYCIVLLYC